MGANGTTANAGLVVIVVWVMAHKIAADVKNDAMSLIVDLLSNDVERQPKANAATRLSLNTFTIIAIRTMTTQCLRIISSIPVVYSTKGSFIFWGSNPPK
jgi:hypothetical protein